MSAKVADKGGIFRSLATGIGYMEAKVEMANALTLRPRMAGLEVTIRKSLN